MLLGAWLLDAAAGDPEKLPHPVRAIGAYIRLLEKGAAHVRSKKLYGVIMGITVPLTAYAITLCIIWCAAGYSFWLGALVSTISLYYCFSTRCLSDEALAVLRKLQVGDLASARSQLSRIVGRDTKQLSEPQVIQAAIETVAENTVDGIISPLFYAVLGGAPLAMAFKAVSTLDSMIGYKNEKYRELGFFSARFDDALNYIPARLCLVIVPLACLFVTSCRAAASFAIGFRDCRNSTSPNSGYPEACFAGALGIQLGGRCSYAGVMVHKPFLGDSNRQETADDVRTAVALLWAVSALSLALFAGSYYVLYLISRGC